MKGTDRLCFAVAYITLMRGCGGCCFKPYNLNCTEGCDCWQGCGGVLEESPSISKRGPKIPLVQDLGAWRFVCWGDLGKGRRNLKRLTIGIHTFKIYPAYNLHPPSYSDWYQILNPLARFIPIYVYP